MERERNRSIRGNRTMNRGIRIELLGLAATVVSVAPAAAQIKRTDSLQTLGVGARSIGMGGAFVASPEDLTGIFWNPAGLSFLDRPEVSADFRTLPRATFRGLAQEIDTGRTSLQYAFFGFAYPLRGGKAGTGFSAQRGTIAFARTLGGYEQTLDTTTTRVPSIARYWFNSIGYGRSVSASGDLRIGAAIHLVELNVLTADPTGAAGTVEGATEGLAFGVGLLYEPRKLDKNLRIGLSYLSPTRVGDIGPAGAIFGDQISGRISLGTRYLVKEKGKHHTLVWTTEVRKYFGGDDSRNVLERRSPTFDYHTGLEFQFPTRLSKQSFARAGFLTRNASDNRLFFDDRVVTAGIGVKFKEFQFDTAAEVSVLTRDASLLASVRYKFPTKGEGSKDKPATGASANAVSAPEETVADRIKKLEAELQALKLKIEQSAKSPGSGDR